MTQALSLIDKNIIVTLHNYDPMSFTHQGAQWVKNPSYPINIKCCNDEQKQQIVKSLDEAKLWADKNKYPILIGEFGSYNKADTQSRVNYNKFLIQEIEKRNMGWIYWNMIGGFGICYYPCKFFLKEIKDSLLQ